METITIRSMTEQELEMVMGWAAAEKWNVGKYDHKPYYAMGKEGYLLILVDGKPVGSISIVKYSERFSFIGLFIVIPEYRSRGLGKMLWQRALKHLEKLQTIGLYAVPKQVPRYKESGFNESFRNERWLKKSPEKAEDITPLMNKTHNAFFHIDKLFEYDKKVFGHNRQPLLQNILTMPQTFGVVSFGENGKVTGYGVVRPCQEGFRMGPFYANDFESAQLISRVLLSEVPGESVILDMPTLNKFGKIFAEYFNLERISTADTIAMFKGEEPVEIQNDKCYGINSLELG